jgi:hypothetical protein
VLFSTGWSDGASVYSVGALTGLLGSTAILDLLSDQMIRRLRRGEPLFIRRYYFSGNLFQQLASLAKPINMTPPSLSWAAFAILKIYCSQGEEESGFLPFGILFLFIEELFVSDQECSRCIHGLAECSGQVEVCGLVTLGVWWLLDGLGALGVIGELLEIVGASRKAWCTQFETHRSGDGEWVLLVSTCILVTQGGAIL